MNSHTVGIRNATDFSPFGVELKGRNFEVVGGGNYRYSFQGQESDSEVKGEGNSVNYKYRMHDPRLGRFFAVDPLANKYPELTPYQFASNSPIFMVEFEGLEGTMYMYRVWEDAEGKHSVSVGSDVVPGLTSNLNKKILMPYGNPPDGKPIRVEYTDAHGTATGLIPIDEKPTVSELNEVFGNQLPKPESVPEKTFGQAFNEAAPAWMRDGAMDGYAEPTNLGDSKVFQTLGEIAVVAIEEIIFSPIEMELLPVIPELLPFPLNDKQPLFSTTNEDEKK
jgi:RHS repeat-associated protein